jgi:hypothetical protein
MKKDKKEIQYVGLIFIGGGSTWFQGSDIGHVSVKCARLCKRDWQHLFKFKRNHVFPVNIYDISEIKDEWCFDYINGLHCVETNKQIKLLKTVYAC